VRGRKNGLGGGDERSCGRIVRRQRERLGARRGEPDARSAASPARAADRACDPCAERVDPSAHRPSAWCEATRERCRRVVPARPSSGRTVGGRRHVVPRSLRRRGPRAGVGGRRRFMPASPRRRARRARV